jgi:hypothetical protein
MSIQEIIEEVAVLSKEERAELMLVLAQLALEESTEAPLKPRIAGLHAGTTWISDDFDEPLLS